MTIDTLQRAALFLLLCLVQVLVLDNIQLFHCATPLLYVYFPLTYPRGYAKWAGMLWAFALGLIVDIFANTPGLAAASLTLVAMLQPYLLELFLPRDASEDVRSAVATLGAGKFFTMSAILVFIFCLTFFTLEAFSFFNWQHWLACIFGSTAITLLLIMTIEQLRRNKQ